MKHLIFILLSTINTNLFLNAQTPDLSTPYKTIESHLKYLSKENFNPDLAAKTIYLKGATPTQLKSLAIKLKQYYASKGLIVKRTAVSDNQNYFDSARMLAYYYPFENISEIYLEKIGNNWYYSSETAQQIIKLHKSVFRFGTDKVLNLLPKIGSNKLFGILVWQLYGIIGLLIIGFLVFEIFRLIFGIIVFRIIRHFISDESSKKFIKPLARPLSIVVAIIAFLLFLPVLQFDAEINYKFILIGKILISVFSMILFYRLVDVLGAYLLKAAMKTESTLDDQLVPLLTKSLKAVVIIIGILFILQNLKFNITALLAGISIGGLAIALAAQDSIKNFFGSLLIFVDKPFQVGDWIITDKVDGTVEEVGFRSTRVRTVNNSLITIPNGKLADQPIDNMGVRVMRRFKTELLITYDTPTYKIENFVIGLKSLVNTHHAVKKDQITIQLAEMGLYALKINFQIFFETSDYNLEIKYRHEILIGVLKLAEALKIRWAYPTETMFIEELPGQPSLSPRHTENPEDQKRRLSGIVSTLKKSFSVPEKTTKNVLSAHEVAPEIVNKEEKKSPEISESPKEIITHKKGRELVEFEIREAANTMKVDINILKTLIEIEGKNKSFLKDGRPSIIFQGHRFWKELKKRNIDPLPLQEKFPDIVYPTFNRKYIHQGEKEYERLEKAKNIHKESAYLSTQWGMFKMSGHHFKECGFSSVNEMVHNFYKTENEQLKALVNFYQSKGIVEDIRNENWEEYGKKSHGKTFNSAKFIKEFEKIYNNQPKQTE